MSILKSKKVGFKLEAARMVNKYFSEREDISVNKLLKENQNIRGFEFLENAKAFLSDIIPAEISEQLSNGSMYAEEKDLYVVYDPDKSHTVLVMDKSGNNVYVNQINSVLRIKRVLQDLYKYLGDESAYTQLGFHKYSSI